MRQPAALCECNDLTCYLHDMHISGIDLNLAVVLRALLDERSVSRAAKRIGLSQSATSHALGRLRALMKDPLFVRTRTGFVPTARAEAMAGAVRAAVAALEETLVSPTSFDPRTLKRTFRVRPSDYVEYLLIARLLEGLASVAPGVQVFAKPSVTEPTLALEEGRLDLLIQPIHSGDQTDSLHMEELWEDRLIGVARRGHPLTQGRVTLARFARADHVLVSPRGQPGGMVDEVLEEHGSARRIAFTTPSFLVGPHVVAKTDLVMMLPERIAAAMVPLLRLATFELPVAVAGFRIAMFWHDRHHADPAHRFIRQEVARVAAGLPAPPSLRSRRSRRGRRGGARAARP